jgi:hypothetical protein
MTEPYRIHRPTVAQWRQHFEEREQERKRARQELERAEERRRDRTRLRAEVDTLRSDFDAAQQHREVQHEAVAAVIGMKENEMRNHVEDAVRDLRRELLREVEQLAAKVKRLEARHSREKGEFKFAHERDEEAETGPVELPKFLPAPVLRKTTIN